MRMIMGIATLIGAWFVCGSLGAQPKEPTLPEGQWPKSVKGLGANEKKAQEISYREAATHINKLMRLQDPPLDAFTVNEEYVKKHLLVDEGSPGEDVKVKLHPEDKDEQVFKQWILTFKTDYNWWKDIVRHNQDAERKLRADGRHTLAARVMIGLAVLLLAGFAYVQLDEYTHRRYTTWLRVAGVGVATSVVAAWWYVFLQTTR